MTTLLNEVYELREENQRLRKVIEDRIEVHIRKEKEKKSLSELIKRIRELKIPTSVIDEMQHLSTSQPKINLEEATLIVKAVFAKIKGEVDVSERRYIDCVGFDVINAKEKEDGIYVIECEVGESLFNKEKSRYVAEVSNEGKLLSLTKKEDIDEQTDK